MRAKLLDFFSNDETPPLPDPTLFTDEPKAPDLSMVPRKIPIIVRRAAEEKMPKYDIDRKSKRHYLYDLQKGLCRYCDLPFNKEFPPTLEHMVPMSKGGSNDIVNLCLVCPPCNSLKASYTSFEEVALWCATKIQESFHNQNQAMRTLAFFKRLKDKGIVK
jgi:CRISPR/Cas system Type II protein with McrA/HNH and RuvC-like nuclease domain